ncbi:PREDICTED: uncharacterized protein LOC105955662 [Erythranthe guttata]|uniref:uncharacterized protein LOC105955662 n=1 Tax=Erythranthe guttata TaxID=4155 RepID=UPI00064DE6E2|nr:PREDICTED: uncharacterized protein LOC105955662 [Erythranthe guttata]|eukprot:XP_012834886.1 PREDICTED: uncharacterized protein LOC105955662 [Erythranthe guttata]
MSQRGLGFKVIEDEILCNAYVHHSTDSAVGTYQSKDDLWAKIQNYYNHEAVDVNNLEHRNLRSLSSRFDKIASSCTLFRATLIQVTARNQSGGNAESMFAEAKELYIIKEPKNQPFKFDHAWKILKFHVKWAEPIQPSTSSPMNTVLHLLLEIVHHLFLDIVTHMTDQGE